MGSSLLLVLLLTATLQQSYGWSPDYFYVLQSSLAPGFVEELISNQFSVPTDFAIAPDGRVFVTDKAGIVWVLTDGNPRPQPWIDITPKVNNAVDRGLESIALDPNFMQNRFVYLSYIMEKDEGGAEESAYMASQGRIVRYTEVNGTGDPASEHILVGSRMGEGVPCCHAAHLLGPIMFGEDGTLLAGAGDGAHWDFIDIGVDRTSADASCKATFGEAQDVGSFRAQMLDSLAGKILRFDSATGSGIGPDTHPGLVPNPFFDSQHPDSPRSRVWAYGLRNPWSIALKPERTTHRQALRGPGTIYLGDVGLDTWEEVNVVKGGENFGWPCVEGELAQPLFGPLIRPPSVDQSGISCTQWFQRFGRNATMPLLIYPHSGRQNQLQGACVIGPALYAHGNYKAPFNVSGSASDNYPMFMVDHNSNWVKGVMINPNTDSVASGPMTLAVNTTHVIRIKPHPVSGDLWMLSLTRGLNRFVIGSGDLDSVPPVAVIRSDKASGNFQRKGPVMIRFQGDQSYDTVRGGQITAYSWDFGDNAPLSTEPNPTHIYSSSDAFWAKLTVWSSRGLAATSSIRITTQNEAPKVNITNPPNNFKYPAERSVNFAADISDLETPTGLTIRWDFKRIHNAHEHPNVYSADQASFSLDVSSLDDSAGMSDEGRAQYLVELSVTDKGGLKTMTSITLK